MGNDKGYYEKYINIMQNMYREMTTNFKACQGATQNFPITRSSLKPFLFAVFLDEITRSFQGDGSWCMLFTSYIVLVTKTIKGVTAKLEQCR